MSSSLKFLILAAIIFFGVKYGGQYLLSNEFELYADQKKDPATCEFEIVLGKLHYMQDDYDKAMMRYAHAVDRCPNSTMAEEAEFETARCLEAKHLRRPAYDAYVAFTKKYPGTKRARIADKSAEILQGT